MSDKKVVKIAAFKRARADAKVLCDAGFHKWQIENERRFDVHEGKLITVRRCSRCGTVRHQLQ